MAPWVLSSLMSSSMLVRIKEWKPTYASFSILMSSNCLLNSFTRFWYFLFFDDSTYLMILRAKSVPSIFPFSCLNIKNSNPNRSFIIDCRNSTIYYKLISFLFEPNTLSTLCWIDYSNFFMFGLN